MISVNSSSPYNKTNVLITASQVKSILKRYRVNIDVRDIALYREALVMNHMLNQRIRKLISKHGKKN